MTYTERFLEFCQNKEYEQISRLWDTAITDSVGRYIMEFGITIKRKNQRLGATIK